MSLKQRNTVICDCGSSALWLPLVCACTAPRSAIRTSRKSPVQAPSRQASLGLHIQERSFHVVFRSQQPLMKTDRTMLSHRLLNTNGRIEVRMKG